MSISVLKPVSGSLLAVNSPVGTLPQQKSLKEEFFDLKVSVGCKEVLLNDVSEEAKTVLLELSKDLHNIINNALKDKIVSDDFAKELITLIKGSEVISVGNSETDNVNLFSLIDKIEYILSRPSESDNSFDALFPVNAEGRQAKLSTVSEDCDNILSKINKLKEKYPEDSPFSLKKSLLQVFSVLITLVAKLANMSLVDVKNKIEKAIKKIEGEVKKYEAEALQPSLTLLRNLEKGLNSIKEKFSEQQGISEESAGNITNFA